MNRLILLICTLTLATAWNTLNAAELSTESVGSDVRQWLEFQRSAVAASTIQQGISGPVAANIYDRYLKSFTYPIPEYFPRGDEED